MRTYVYPYNRRAVDGKRQENSTKRAKIKTSKVKASKSYEKCPKQSESQASRQKVENQTKTTSCLCRNLARRVSIKVPKNQKVQENVQESCEKPKKRGKSERNVENKKSPGKSKRLQREEAKSQIGTHCAGRLRSEKLRIENARLVDLSGWELLLFSHKALQNYGETVRMSHSQFRTPTVLRTKNSSRCISPKWRWVVPPFSTLQGCPVLRGGRGFEVVAPSHS